MIILCQRDHNCLRGKPTFLKFIEGVVREDIIERLHKELPIEEYNYITRTTIILRIHNKARNSQTNQKNPKKRNPKIFKKFDQKRRIFTSNVKKRRIILSQ